MRKGMSRENGFALPSTLMLLLLLFTAGAAASLYTVLDLKSANHYTTGNQALYAAEAGALHALSEMNQSGVMDFANDVVNRWEQLLGSGVRPLVGYPQFTFRATVAVDPLSPADRGWIMATGWAPYQARRVIRIGIKRGAIGRGVGAIYLAADSVTPSFSGNAFEIDGNDHDAYGTLTGGTVAPGIATRSDSVAGSVKAALNNQQRDNVRGLGFLSIP